MKLLLSVRPRMNASGGNLHGLALEQLLRTLLLDHVVQGIVEGTQVRVDLRHQVTREKAEPFAGFDRRPGEDDALHLLGLEGVHRHCNSQPTLAGTGRAEAEGDHIGADRVDVLLLAGRLRSDRASLGSTHDVVAEHGARPLVVQDHVDGATEDGFVEVLPALEQHHEFFHETAGAFGITTLEVHLVPADHDRGLGEGTLDLAEEHIARTAQGGHDVRTRNHHGVGDRSSRHAGRAATVAAE